MDWKLTDEELRDTSKVAADKWLEQPPATSDEAGWVQAIDEAQRSLTLAVRRAIADAAVRKVVEWGRSHADAVEAEGLIQAAAGIRGAMDAIEQEVGL